jgi:hypothetical protein
MTRLFEQPLTDEVSSGSRCFEHGEYEGLYCRPCQYETQTSNATSSIAYKEKLSKYRPSLLPSQVVVEGAKAMEFGAQKYGVDQWKTVDMEARQFIDALERHLIAYKQGERVAGDSQVSHLGHIIANCAILLARFENN